MTEEKRPGQNAPEIEKKPRKDRPEMPPQSYEPEPETYPGAAVEKEVPIRPEDAERPEAPTNPNKPGL